MKKIFWLIAIAVLAIVISGCDGDNSGNKETDTRVALRFNNDSSVPLANVVWNGISFGNLSAGGYVEELVALGGSGSIFFNIVGSDVNYKTQRTISSEDGSFTFNNATPILETNASASSQPLQLINVFNALSKPVFELRDNDNNIIDNNEPIPFNFGRIELTTGSSPFIFRIHNVGSLPLELNGSPIILSSNPVFSIPSQPTSTTINPGANIPFVVIYTPTDERVDTGIITILNNTEEVFFTLNVKGTGFLPVPQISVKQGSTVINPAGEYDFGGVVTNSTKDVTFTIENIGGENLIFTEVSGSRVSISENIGSAFSIIQQPSTAVIPGSSSNFIIRFAPSLNGSSYSANVRIKTNSINNDEFLITLKGSCHDVVSVVPTGVQATAQSSSSINITWNTVAGATSYKVYYGTSSTSITIIANAAVTGTLYTHLGLEPNTLYYYRVVATNSAGDSGYSTSTSARTKLSTPTGIIATGESASSIRISWNTVSGATSYKIYSGTSSSSITNQVGTATGSSYSHSGLQSGTTYYYRVVAYNTSAGDSESSSTASGITKLAEPTGLVVSNPTANSLKITWNTVSGATSYKLYNYLNNSLIATVSSTSYSHTGLQGGTTYYYYVVAYSSAAGDSDNSWYEQGTTICAAPTSVTASRNSMLSIGSNSVSWTSSTGASSYKIYYTTGSSSGTKTLAGTSTYTSFTHNISASTTFYYFVVAVNGSGDSAYSTSSNALVVNIVDNF